MSIPTFRWDTTPPSEMDRALRRVLVMMSMATEDRPLDVEYLQILVDHLQQGLTNARRRNR